MPFDPTTAELVGSTKFDPSTATIVKEPEQPKTFGQKARDFLSPTIGVLEAARSVGAQAVAAPVSGFAGIAGTALPGPEGQGADWVRRVQGTVPQPQTGVGQEITGAVSYPFEKLAQGAEAVGGKVTDITGSPALGMVANVGIQSIPMIAGKVTSKIAPGGELPSTKAARLTKEAQNVNKDAIITELRDADYALPLSQTNPTMATKTVEGLAGKVKGNQDYSLHNQEITNRLVRDEFGIPQDKPLTLDFFRNYRRAEGQKYDAARQTGEVELSDTFRDSVSNAVSAFKSVAKDAPELQEAVRSDMLRRARVLSKKDTLDSGTVVDLINQFRERANSLYDNKQPTPGRAAKDLANALEQELQDHVARTGQSPEVVQGVIDARRNIAKSHNVEDALTASGDVDARALGSQWDAGRGVPFSGNLLTVAKLGYEYPKVAQIPRKIGGVPSSYLDYATMALMKLALSGGATAGAAGGAVLAGHPWLAAAAIPFARPLVRNALASHFMQTAMGAPSYGPSWGSRLLSAQQQPITPLAEIAQGQRQ